MQIDSVKFLLSSQGEKLLSSCDSLSYHQFIDNYSKKLNSIELSAIAEQLKSKELLRRKNSLWLKKKCLVEKSLLEQSTALKVAQFRATVIKGHTLCDCTGGMGVDTVAFSSSFNSVMYCEIDESRALLFQHNLKVLNINNIDIRVSDSIKLLGSIQKKFDWLFIDPARRNNSGKRFISLEECSPNIIENIDLFLNSSNNIAVKISPAFEIDELLKKIDNISKVFVISLDREVREILFTIEKDVKFDGTEVVIINENTITRHKVNKNIQLDITNEFKYLYEPDPAIIKARAVDSYGNEFNLKRLSINSQFLISNVLMKEFLGRIFIVVATFAWNRKDTKRYLKENNLTKATIIRRNFPLKPEELRKAFKLKEDSNNFLIFTTDSSNKKVVIHAQRI